MRRFAMLGLLLTIPAVSQAAPVVSSYEDLEEGFYGPTLVYQGVTYRDVNQVSGTNADGSTFVPGDNGSYLPVEDATYLFNDFPTFGSGIHALTFGDFMYMGPNLNIGPLASVYLDMGTASAASLDIAYYENGPWGGIVYHLDALLDGVVVDSDTYTLADGGGRDNVSFTTLSVEAAQFNGLHLYATLGSDYTNPRGIIDNLSITYVPEPAAAGLIAAVAPMLMRRRV